MIEIGSKVKAKDGFVGYVIYKTYSNLFAVVKNKEDLGENPASLSYKYGHNSGQWGSYYLEELKEIKDSEDKIDAIVKLAFIIQVVAIVFIALTIIILTIQTQIENDKKFDSLYDNQMILQKRLEELERGSK